MRFLSFVVFCYALSTGTWWLFVLAFLMWQVLGSGHIIKSLWVIDKFHDKDSDHGP